MLQYGLRINVAENLNLRKLKISILVNLIIGNCHPQKHLDPVRIYNENPVYRFFTLHS